MSQEYRTIQVIGNQVGRRCPVCGNDCWTVRVMGVPDQRVYCYTCSVCLRRSELKGQPAAPLLLAVPPERLECAMVSGV